MPQGTAVRHIRLAMRSIAMVSCLLLLQGCGALQGCPERKTICQMI
jgi:hypothetical protein